jgi:hypothetical protein
VREREAQVKAAREREVQAKAVRERVVRLETARLPLSLPRLWVGHPKMAE